MDSFWDPGQKLVTFVMLLDLGLDKVEYDRDVSPRCDNALNNPWLLTLLILIGSHYWLSVSCVSLF